MYRYGIYEKALYKRPLPDLLDHAARAGYDNFELSLDESDERLSRLEWDRSQRLSFQRAASDSGVQVYSACFSGQRRFPMGSADETLRKTSMDLMRKAVRFCADTGIRVLQVAGYDVWYEPSTEESRKRYRDGLARAAVLAERSGILLGIEPVESHITSVRKAMELVREIGSPVLHVYPDAANLVTAGLDPVSELTLARGHMLGLHIRDANPHTCFNLPIGTGTLDFVGVYRCLAELDFHAPVLVELWYEQDPNGEHIIREHLDYLKTTERSVRFERGMKDEI
ncbi:MAG: L-ribulose-5-phosphate 3-epimerase [Clostridia bacterium]|nr:L-ribulose-5-phosphate 3-epimerase [Clostridia bacterium]MBQ6475804.1 L-ribulose-5-phosphate 3-epimerase [Clostridia bacterium]MBR0445020.1 L-ribulose-5-phosphate 3-epimerase [Clostridia bacterium]MCR5073936.1 L-ribulose-5-phosphate 3-epimerase [Clostridiales bacterium]